MSYADYHRIETRFVKNAVLKHLVLLGKPYEPTRVIARFNAGGDAHSYAVTVWKRLLTHDKYARLDGSSGGGES